MLIFLMTASLELFMQMQSRCSRATNQAASCTGLCPNCSSPGHASLMSVCCEDGLLVVVSGGSSCMLQSWRGRRTHYKLASLSTHCPWGLARLGRGVGQDVSILLAPLFLSWGQ